MRLAVKRGKFFRYILLIWLLFWLGFLMVVLYFYSVRYNWFGMFGPIPSIELLENPKNEIASEMFTSDNIKMGKFFRENRTPIEYEEVSNHVINALIATEDVRHEEHSGVDLRALLRVVFTAGKDGGGSTISQQVAKNLFKIRRDSTSRGWLSDVKYIGTLGIKSKEWVTATMIEERYTKKEIIEMYLNTVEFGHNAFGIHSAAKIYFNKKPIELDLIESATLVGMLKAPTRFNPISNYERSVRRRNTVMQQMVKYGMLSQSDYDVYSTKPIKVNRGREDHISGIAPYFRQQAEKFLKRWAKENDRDLYSDGLKIYTSLDSRMQKHAEEAVREHMIKFQKIFYGHWKDRNPWVDVWNREIPNFIETEAKKTYRWRQLKKKYKSEKKAWKVMNTPRKMTVFSWEGEKDTILTPLDSIRYFKHFLQTGFVAMEPKTGQVKAWVGGIDFKYFKYDHVQQGIRQPGSTFKPIVYAAAIDNGYTGCYKMPDVPVRFRTAGGGYWTPRNATLVYSHAMMSLRDGLRTSTNSIAAGLMKKLGPKVVAKYAREFGIKSELDESPPLCLGASDVSPLELLGAYCVFANRGKHIEPYFITRIEDRHGNVIEEFVPQIKQIISEEVAYQMLHMMMGTVEPGGTATAIHGYGGDLKSNPGWHNEVAAKTGTTQNNSDAWFMGVTQHLAAGVWVGGDNRAIRFRTIVLGQGAVLALPVWGKFMAKVYGDPELHYPKGAFERPEDLSVELDCSKMMQPLDYE